MQGDAVGVTSFSQGQHCCSRTTHLFPLWLAKGLQHTPVGILFGPSMQDTMNLLQTKVKGNLYWSQWSLKQTWLKERWEKSFALIHYGCWLYTEVNWPLYSVLCCLDYARLSQPKCFFPIITFSWCELQFVNKITPPWETEEQAQVSNTHTTIFSKHSAENILFFPVLANMLICFLLSTQHPY